MEATVPRSGDTVAKETARDESLPRSGLLTRLRPLEHDLRHRVGILARNAHGEEASKVLEEEVWFFRASLERTAETMLE